MSDQQPQDAKQLHPNLPDEQEMRRQAAWMVQFVGLIALVSFSAISIAFSNDPLTAIGTTFISVAALWAAPDLLNRSGVVSVLLTAAHLDRGPSGSARDWSTLFLIGALLMFVLLLVSVGLTWITRSVTIAAVGLTASALISICVVLFLLIPFASGLFDIARDMKKHGLIQSNGLGFEGAQFLALMVFIVGTSLIWGATFR